MKYLKWALFGLFTLFVVLTVSVLLLIKSVRKDESDYEKKQTTPNGQSSLIVGSEYLNQFKDGDADILLRHLRGSPNWFITREHGTVVAKRRKTTGDLLLGFNGSLGEDASDDYTRHFDLVFNKRREGDYYAKPGHFQQFAPGAEPVTVQTFNWNGSLVNYASYVVVKGRAPLFIEIYDSSFRDAERKQTQATLLEVEQEIRNVLRHPEEVERRGVAKAYALPKNRIGSDELNVVCLMNEPQCANHYYSVYTTFSPKIAGEAYLKVRRGNEYLNEEYVKRDTLELMGWSADSKNRFLYNAYVSIPDLDKRYDVVEVELWFIPAGGAEYKVASRVVTVFTKSCEDDDSCDSFR